jgi:small subunit ribosomal protein S20
MPHTKSARKNLRKSEKRRLRNRAVKRTVKTYVKRFMAALDGPVEALQTEYNLAAGQLDKAAAKGVLHRNTVSRKKSQLGRALHDKVSAAKGAPPAKA